RDLRELAAQPADRAQHNIWRGDEGQSTDDRGEEQRRRPPAVEAATADARADLPADEDADQQPNIANHPIAGRSRNAPRIIRGHGNIRGTRPTSLSVPYRFVHAPGCGPRIRLAPTGTLPNSAPASSPTPGRALLFRHHRGSRYRR